MIDISTIHSLELMRNIKDGKVKGSLYGVVNTTLTPMGARMLRCNLVQPSTLKESFLVPRYDAVQEFVSNEEMFAYVRKGKSTIGGWRAACKETKPLRQGLRGFSDIERVLTKLIIVPSKPSIRESEQAINNILMIKSFLKLVSNLYEALQPAESALLLKIRSLCSPEVLNPPLALILETIQEDVTYVKNPLDLRNQRTFAVKVSSLPRG